ncbi:MAG: GIY-YIG nuclease family protein [Candidatus Moranbacteria bacterium]|nr:GIY-YIG nuclease family protein [Candidatus Moranbacteria bacterium]
MHYVYLIKSKKLGELYLGCTNDLRERLLKHNSNKVKSTKFKGPWEVRYYEAFYSKADAFSREKKLKQNYRGLQELKKRTKESLT